MDTLNLKNFARYDHENKKLLQSCLAYWLIYGIFSTVRRSSLKFATAVGPQFGLNMGSVDPSVYQYLGKGTLHDTFQKPFNKCFRSSESMNGAQYQISFDLTLALSQFELQTCM